jgi:integrase
MKARLTDRLIKTVIARQTPYEIVDSEISGFILRIQPSGVFTYYLVYRTTNGTKKRYRLGRHGSVTVTQARDLAKQFSAKALSGQDIQEDKKRAQFEKEKTKARTLEGFIDLHYAPWVKVERKTGLDTIKRINLNFSYLMKFPLEDISPWLIEKWRTEQIKRGKMATTVNRDIATLKSVLSKAAAWGWLEGSPLVKLKPLKTDNRAKERDRQAMLERASANCWRASRQYSLLPNLGEGMFCDHLTPMVLLSMHTGLRRGELFNLCWDHIDLSKAMITVAGDKAKSGKTRHVPLNAKALYALQTWNKQCSKHDLVFPSKEGKRMNNVRKSWAGVLRKASITHFRWHDLRHHFASKLVMAGVDLNTVRELLGHADLTITLRYAHLAPEHKADAVARLVSA